MAVVSAVFMVLSLGLAVTLGPQTRPWTWGPSLIALGVAAAAGLPVVLRSRRLTDQAFLWGGAAVAGWFAWRAWFSPVAELAIADLLLLGAAVGSFLAVRVMAESAAATKVFFWGLAVLTTGQLAMMGVQLAAPEFNPIYGARPVIFSTGFYAHYNEAANFLICSCSLLAAAALVGDHGRATRAFWLLVALACLPAIFVSGSRGGVLAAAIAALCFLILLLVIGKRRKAKWFAPLAIAIPLVLIAACGFLFYGWQHAQQLRNDDTGISRLMDNSIRLYLMGIAMSCIQAHPWAGGGSRSFSWECYQYWTVQDNGWDARRPELVHNELLQAFTDYGITGGGLLILLLVSLLIAGLVKLLLADGKGRPAQADVFYLGGMAGLVGMFIQSSFSFVFHLLPGIMLLGICLGLLAIPGSVPQKAGKTGLLAAKGLLAGVSMLLAVAMISTGIKGSRVLATLWRTNYEKQPTARTDKLDALASALRIWPQAVLYGERAFILQNAVREDMEGGLPPGQLDEAISDYQVGSRLHPHDPALAVSLANLLSIAGRNDEAEVEYRRAVTLQGGMELGFHAWERSARHYQKKGRDLLMENEPEAAAEAFNQARADFSEIGKGFPSFPNLLEGQALAASIDEGSGLAKEGSGDLDGALAAYDALALRQGTTGHYRYGLLLHKMAYTDWYERRAPEALGKFLKARERIAMAGTLPSNVTPEARAKTLESIDGAIATLRAGKIEPR